MRDFECYQNALEVENSEDYMNSLNRSLSLAMDEFYGTIKATGVSAATGEGVE